MPGTPFEFQTAADYARTGDLDTVLAQVFAPASESGLARDTQAQMMAGLASRADLTAPLATRILREADSRWYDVLAALLNNPRLRRAPKTYAEACRHISPDAISTLLARLDDPTRVLPHLLLAAHRHSMFDDVARYIRDAFDADTIHAAADRLVADYLDALVADDMDIAEVREMREVPRCLFLTAEHITRIATQVRDMLRDLCADTNGAGTMSAAAASFATEVLAYQNAESALTRLAARTDLTIEHGHLLMDAIEFIAEDEQRYHAEHQVARGGHRNFDFRSMSRIPRMIANSAIPQPVRVRAILHPYISDVLTFNSNIRIGLDTEHVIDALRQGAPAHLVERYGHLNLPADVVEIILDQIETHGCDLSVLRAVTRSAEKVIGTPIWDRLYGYWLAHVPTNDEGEPVQDQFADLIERRALNWADDSTTPVLHQFAAWAARQSDPLMRRHAVKHVWSTEQMLAATDDPSPVVRMQALDHEYVPEPILLRLAADTDPAIREAIASHRDTTTRVLAALHADPHTPVRRAVANHPCLGPDSLSLLSSDPDEQTRELAAERFLAALC